jgi:hypothetical protein
MFILEVPGNLAILTSRAPVCVVTEFVIIIFETCVKKQSRINEQIFRELLRNQQLGRKQTVGLPPNLTLGNPTKFNVRGYAHVVCVISEYMSMVDTTLYRLKRELEFVDSGGYRMPVAWRSPLFFEDSPSCPKKSGAPCPNTDCDLMGFVPKGCRFEAVPCRHIPLNEVGETIDSLYRTGTNKEIESAVRNWLLETIRQLEKDAPLETSALNKEAA